MSSKASKTKCRILDRAHWPCAGWQGLFHTHRRAERLPNQVMAGYRKNQIVNATPAAAGTKLSGIEALRGIAALLVAAMHCRQTAWVGMSEMWHANHFHVSLNSIIGYLSAPLVFGGVGVPIFFVISGYVIHRGSARKLAQNPEWRLDAPDFLFRRFVRIYPLLLTSLILTFALDTASSHFLPLNQKLGDLGLLSFWGNLGSVQGIFVPHYGSNGALWTLSLEVQFYLVYPLALEIRRRIGARPMLALVGLINLASYFCFERSGILIFTSYYFSWYLGAYIADLEALGKDNTHKRATYFIAASIFLLGCAVMLFEKHAFGNYLAVQFWALGFASFLSVFKTQNVRGRVWAAFAVIGGFSYSLYVVHLPVFVFLVSAIFHSSLQYSILPALAFFMVALGVAYGTYLLVELPCIKYLDQKKVLKARAMAAKESIAS